MRLYFCAVLTSIACIAPAWAQVDIRVGFVNAERIMRESAPAVRAQKRLDKEFEKRDQELQRSAKQLQLLEDSLDRNSVTMPDAERKQKERQFNDLSRDFQRRKREYQEDRNQRQNEELAGVLERANRVIRQVAEAEKIDLIVQEVVYFNPRIDVTEKVLKALVDTPLK